MAPVKLHLAAATALGSNHHQMANIPPSTTANITTGWKVTGVIVGKTSMQVASTERGTGSFLTEDQLVNPPNNSIGDCWRSVDTYKGTFAEGDWTFNINLISLTAQGPGAGKPRMKIWKGTDPTGENATLVRDTFISDQNFGNNTTPLQCTATVFVNQTEFKNEYIFLQMSWIITVRETNANVDVHFRQSTLSTIMYMETAEFMPAQDIAFEGFEDGDLYAAPLASDFNASPSPVNITMQDVNAIPAVTSVDLSTQTTPGEANVEHQDFEIEPVFGDDLEVSYSANETNWLLGEYLI